MDAFEKFAAQYRAAEKVGIKAALLDKITDLLPDRRAFDFLLGVIEGDRPEDEGPRVAAMKLLWACDLGSDADRQRVIAALTRIARGSPSPVERVHAISELAAFLDDEPVRALFHQMRLDPNELDDARQTAISALPSRRPPAPETIAICQRLRDDPLLGTSARLRLTEWHVERHGPAADVGAQLSAHFGRAPLVRYDDRTGVKTATLFEGGRQGRTPWGSGRAVRPLWQGRHAPR
jgi:hypothetical protein